MASSTPYTEQTVPTRVTQASDWTRPATGTGLGISCGAIKADGSLWTWGMNFCGMLGRQAPEWDNWTTPAGASSLYHPVYTPAPVGGNDWADVSFGANHVLAVKTDGSLWAWGYREGGRLGDNVLVALPPERGYVPEEQVQPLPKRIGTGNDWAEVQAGASISVGRRTDNTLWRWGGGILAPERVGAAGDRFSAFSVGESHVLAVRQGDGSLWAWGWNGYGQLGTGDTTDAGDPVLVAAGPWKAVGAGTHHSLAVKADGTLWSFGDNFGGKLGDGSQDASLVPVRVGAATDWVAADGGDEFSVALKEKMPDGKLWLWGANDAGQLGNGLTASTVSPAVVSPPRGWRAAFPGAENTFGILADGTLWGWGSNWDGELGDGTTTGRQLPVRIGAAVDWTAASSASHTLALKADGSLWSWGSNIYGELGTGAQVPRSLPGRVGTAFYRSVAAGWQSSFAIREDGTLWAWGLDTYNRLGVGHAFPGTAPVPPPDTTPVPDMFVLSPTQVGTSAGWKQVSASHTQTAAVRDDGSLWEWGLRGYLSLLPGAATLVGTPQRVGTDSDWAFVATGTWHTAALKRDGSLWAWGGNMYGEIGDGTFSSRPAPVRIGSESWRSVAVRSDRTAAVMQDGSLWEWGGFWQYAPGAPASGSNAPVRVGSGNQWASVSASPDGSHWAAMQADGSLFTWGENWDGQLGNRAAWSAEPVWIP
jgi:YD repeat-containing protein